MESFDENLIIFQKIFKVPKILETYLSCEDDLLKGSKKMDLFSFGAGKSMALFLGSKFQNKNLFHYFLIEYIVAGENHRYEIGNISIQEVPDGRLFPNFMNTKIIRKEVLENEYKDLTISNFIKMFNEDKIGLY